METVNWIKTYCLRDRGPTYVPTSSYCLPGRYSGYLLSFHTETDFRGPAKPDLLRSNIIFPSRSHHRTWQAWLISQPHDISYGGIYSIIKIKTKISYQRRHTNSKIKLLKLRNNSHHHIASLQERMSSKAEHNSLRWSIVSSSKRPPGPVCSSENFLAIICKAAFRSCVWAPYSDAIL